VFLKVLIPYYTFEDFDYNQMKKKNILEAEHVQMCFSDMFESLELQQGRSPHIGVFPAPQCVIKVF